MLTPDIDLNSRGKKELAVQGEAALGTARAKTQLAKEKTGTNCDEDFSPGQTLSSPSTRVAKMRKFDSEAPSSLSLIEERLRPYTKPWRFLAVLSSWTASVPLSRNDRFTALLLLLFFLPVAVSLTPSRLPIFLLSASLGLFACALFSHWLDKYSRGLLLQLTGIPAVKSERQQFFDYQQLVDYLISAVAFQRGRLEAFSFIEPTEETSAVCLKAGALARDISNSSLSMKARLLLEPRLTHLLFEAAALARLAEERRDG